MRDILVLEPGMPRLSELLPALRLDAGQGVTVSVLGSESKLLEALRQDGGATLAVIPLKGLTTGRGRGSLIRRIRKVSLHAPVVVVAESGDVQTAAQAISAGATDFLVVGDRLAERAATLLGKLRGLFAVIERNRQLDQANAQLRATIEARFQLIGQAPAMLRLVEQIHRVSRVRRPILISGERGTGKEIVARAVHFSGGEETRPLVTVNCAAFNDSLLESELFGHEQGAFTGADETRTGKFERASGGTLFLDEIGHMSLAFQQKILRLVEYGTFSRVGGATEIHTTARVIAATNCDLHEQIRRGKFLADLYDRLAFEVLMVPPLRERRGDIELLSNHFLEQFAREIPAFLGKRLSTGALDELRRYAFPGNVRELKNIIERAAYRETHLEITVTDLGLSAADEPLGPAGSFRDKVERYRRKLIDDALRQADGNQAQAARLLGLSYHQFRYYLTKTLASHAE